MIQANPLLNAASPLLMLLANFKQTQDPECKLNVAFRQKIVEEIALFLKNATESHCPQNQVLAARYCLCTAIDEFILVSSWGIKNNWHYLTLLSLIHKETSGGEKFFVILEEMAKLPKENLNLLELIYVILNLGFEGKYYNDSNSILPQIRHQLFNLIKLHGKEPEKYLAPNLQLTKAAKPYNPDSWSKLKITSLAATMVIGIGFVFNLITYYTARQPLEHLWALSQQAAKTALPIAQQPAPTLAMLESKPLLEKKNLHKVAHHSRHHLHKSIRHGG
ncbi:MAG: type IVB secretion system protein IcmH/DotU [Proteobacteria bacterium]|nr:type IVB secretion system protein IcmH/DotU [Pseudomonadota bacterium]